MNFVSLVGKFRGEYDEKTRYLEVNRPDEADNLMIPCRYWTQTGQCLLTAQKEGTLAIVRGRLDHDKTIGFYLLVEQIIPVLK